MNAARCQGTVSGSGGYYKGVCKRPAGHAGRPAWLDEAAEGRLTADELLGHYCRQLYDRHGSYEEVARRTALDRRTVKKHVTASAPPHAADRGGL